MNKSLFGMDSLGNISIEGWSDGTLWNGWSRPHFEFAEAQTLLSALQKVYDQMGGSNRAWYDEAEDSFCFLLEGDEEPDCYSSMTIETKDGGQLKVYPIGAGAWIWEELVSEGDY